MEHADYLEHLKHFGARPTPIDNFDFSLMLGRGQKAALLSLVQSLTDTWKAAQKTAHVHDGQKPAEYTFIGRAHCEPVFNLVTEREYWGHPVGEWRSARAEFKTGDVVRRVGLENIPTLHLILTVTPAPSAGYSHKRTTGYSVCIERPYHGGIGLGGIEKPAAPTAP